MVGEQFVKPDSVFSKLQKVLLKCNPMFFSVVTSFVYQGEVYLRQALFQI